ncbi:hypothetical protein MUGA111182_20860 [Mucilaginibacter galii]|uniref:hypothetical protein n=1 Tax=Mucilaginibacter galii TaxID=2005073 RepID=UPI00363F26AB
MFPLLERKHLVSLFFSAVPISLSHYYATCYFLKNFHRLASRFSFYVISRCGCKLLIFVSLLIGSAKVSKFFNSAKNILFYFLKPFRVKNPLQVAYLPLFNFFPLIAIGSAKVEVFFNYPKFIFNNFGDPYSFNVLPLFLRFGSAKVGLFFALANILCDFLFTATQLPYCQGELF